MYLLRFVTSHIGYFVGQIQWFLNVVYFSRNVFHIFLDGLARSAEYLHVFSYFTRDKILNQT